MNDIKKKVFEMYAKVKCDINLLRYTNLYDELSELLDILRKDYVIISKDNIRARAHTEVTNPNPFSEPGAKRMRTTFSVTAKNDFFEEEIMAEFVKNQQLEYLYQELEK